MNNLDRIKLAAARDANMTGYPIAVLNLNPYSPLYVMRKYEERMQNSGPTLIWVAYPSTVEQGG